MANVRKNEIIEIRINGNGLDFFNQDVEKIVLSNAELSKEIIRTIKGIESELTTEEIVNIKITENELIYTLDTIQKITIPNINIKEKIITLVEKLKELLKPYDNEK